MESPSKGIPLRKKRYLLRDSDRSGFTYRNVELVSDEGFLVGGDEFDTPPPSKKLYPGEGDVSPGDTRANYTDYSNQPVNYANMQVVDTNSTISLNKHTDNAGNYTYNKSIVYLAGSSETTQLATDPQIASSNHGDFLTLQGGSNAVVIVNGSGVRLYSSYFKMESGAIINLIYDATNGLWCETSRMYPNFQLTGEF